MAFIKTVCLQNFRRFPKKEINLNKELNILLGDNESGKSSILLGIDLALSASRSRVEAIGVESLLNQEAVTTFIKGSRTVADLPVVEVELFLSDTGRPEYNGKNNSKNIECDGLRMRCEVPDMHSAEVADLLKDPQSPFPFEYYQVLFSTFAGQAYSPYAKPVRHLLLDSSRIGSEYAAREYVTKLYEMHTAPSERYRLESQYRQLKQGYRENQLKDLNAKLTGYQFAVRSTSKSNLENDLAILEQDILLEERGKGRQCQVKTEFALSRQGHTKLDVLLLEEPENHLSHTNTGSLIDSLQKPDNRQLILSTHSSLVCSRLSLRKAILLSATGTDHAALDGLTEGTAEFFMKAPNSKVLEFCLSKKVLLVEGDAEFILIEALYSKHSGGASLRDDKVHVIAVGGTSFKRYLELAKFLKIKTAVIRDNDCDYQKNCVANYKDHLTADIRVFSDDNNTRSTFEICLYQDNTAICDEHLGPARKTSTVQEYMLREKADAAFALLSAAAAELVAPKYIQDAIAWIRG